MRNAVAAALCAAIATGLLALGLSTASARNFSMSTQNIRVTFHEIEFVAGNIDNTCDVTLEGSVHSRTVAKVLNTLMGYVTRVELSNCKVLTTVLTETLPWHVKYTGFSGNLPNISAITGTVRSAFRISICLCSHDFPVVVTRAPATRALTAVTLPSHEVPLIGALCPEPRMGVMRSNFDGTIAVLGGTTAVSVTLI